MSAATHEAMAVQFGKETQSDPLDLHCCRSDRWIRVVANRAFGKRASHNALLNFGN
jgi:uncharacterized protein with PIN domain